MLARLDAESLNCVVYVTMERGTPPPHTMAPTLKRFLKSMVQQGYQEHRFEVEAISPEQLVESAEKAFAHSSKYLSDPEVLFSRSQTQEVLEPLSRLFGKADIPAFTAIVGDESPTEMAMADALSQSGLPCFLVGGRAGQLEVIDPLLPVQMLADVAIPYPQCVFWSKQGAACHLPADSAKHICNALIEARGQPEQIHQIIQRWHRPRMRAVTILHLSDLHYGRAEPVEQEQYLLAHLEGVVPTVDRIVITGDLCDDPCRKNIAAFNNFRRQLERMGREVTVIPGNHDARTGGNAIGKLGRRLGILAELEWSSLIVDDDLRIVFFCFDSSFRGGSGARGRIADRDLLSVAANYQIKRRNNPEIENYFKLVLVHHHPFPFDRKRNLLQSIWSKLTFEDDIYLRLERSEKFVDWCQKMGAHAILHGHKHVPKWFIREGANSISAIGCGSSAGVDGDLSYVIVAVDSVSKRQSACFYRGAKDGTGFEPMYMTATLI